MLSKLMLKYRLLRLTSQENFRHRDVATKARLTYIKGHGVQLDLHLNQWDNWVKCFEISDVILPESPFIGFTAATGDAHDNHE